jgi:hypothetical protein
MAHYRNDHVEGKMVSFFGNSSLIAWVATPDWHTGLAAKNIVLCRQQLRLSDNFQRLRFVIGLCLHVIFRSCPADLFTIRGQPRRLRETQPGDTCEARNPYGGGPGTGRQPAALLQRTITFTSRGRRNSVQKRCESPLWAVAPGRPGAIRPAPVSWSS